MKNECLKRALGLYGRCVLSSLLGVFMYCSVGIIATALTPTGEKLSTAASLVTNLAALVIQGFLFCVIVYSESWRRGDKDGTQAMFGGKAGSAHFGLKVALVASIPSWISYFVLIAEKLFGFWDAYAMLYRAGQLSLYPIIAWTMGSVLNVPAADIPWSGILLSAVPTVIFLAVAWLGYFLGYKQIAVGQRIMYSNKLGRK